MKKIVVVLILVLSVAVASRALPQVSTRLRTLLENPPYRGSAEATPSGNPVDPVLGYQLAGRSALLPAAKWVPQTFNNCGPATTSMILQYFGHNVSQVETKARLRSNDQDTNVFSYEIRDYLKNEFNIGSKLLYNGNHEIIKTLIANGFYVMVEDWLHPNEDIGHFVILRGYDDDQGVYITDDSYIGVNVTLKYQLFDDTQWKPFNREYLPLYRPEQESLVKKIIGADWDQTKMYQNSVKRNQLAVEANPSDMYSWFNLGTSHYALGQYQQALSAFEKSRALGWPRRMLWYQIQPVQTLNKLGQYQQAIDLAQLGLASNDHFNELLLEVAIAYKGLGDINQARSYVNRALAAYPNWPPAVQFANSL